MGIFFSKEYRHKQIVAEANDSFQIREHNDELWLTYRGFLVCPCSMLKDGPVDAIKKMRELYIKRHTTHATYCN